MQITPFSAGLATGLASLFQENQPTPTRLWAMLDGAIRGRYLVDQLAEPKFAIIQDMTEGTIYIGGAVTPATLIEAFTILRSYQDLVVCLWTDDSLLKALPDGHFYQGVAIDFTNRSPTIDLNQLAVIPAGYRIQKINEELAQRIEGYDYYVTMFGSIEQAVQNTIGYCLMHGETIVCEAIAGPLTRGVAEMGIETVEAYRQKGLATITSAYLIRECEALGYRVFGIQPSGMWPQSRSPED